MIEIESLDHYGRGISKINGKVTFIKNALPGEIIDIKVLKNKSKFDEADVKKYFKYSPKRVKVECPYYDTCGGCNIMHLSYEEQLKFKQNKIKNIVSKYINQTIQINDIIGSSFNYYRNKVTFHVKNNNIGFFNENTHELINIDKCIISNDLINNSIKYLKMLNLNSIRNITCRVGSNKLMIIIETSDVNLDITPLKEIADSIYFKFNKEYIHVFKDKYIYENLGNYKFAISPDSFFQNNIDCCIKLYNKIKEYTKTNKKIIDLYCGTGSIGIYISKDNNIVGIEINKSAILDANKNKDLNNLKGIEFILGDSGKKLNNIDFKPDIIVVDPPRSGLNKETISNILKFEPNEILYVSCEPMTMVRDLNILSKKYSIEAITPFDMFPNTYHVECLSYLKKV